MVTDRTRAWLVLAVVVPVAFFLFAPVISGVDICPNGLLAGAPHISISYYYFKFGGIYEEGVGYFFFTGPICA
jgi:hypothetical protein